jgi:hypothetical protein
MAKPFSVKAVAPLAALAEGGAAGGGKPWADALAAIAIPATPRTIHLDITPASRFSALYGGDCGACRGHARRRRAIRVRKTSISAGRLQQSALKVPAENGPRAAVGSAP